MLRDETLASTKAGSPEPRHPRFHVRRTLGEGGYGTVFEAFDRERGELVALKRLHRTTPHALARFKREFRTLAKLAHVGLPRLHELFVHEDDWFFTMELVDGEDLRAHARGTANASTEVASATYSGDLDVTSRVVAPRAARIADAETTRQVRRVLDALADVLDFVHRSGLVHCDVKPSNVRVTRDGRVVLLDFGLARPLREAAGTFAGTLAYAAPEQLAGDFGPAADLYALGSLVFELLAGSPPFGVGAEAAENKQRRTAPALGLSPDDADLEALVAGLLSGIPARRAGALAAYRRGVQAGATPSEPKVVGRDDVLARIDAALDAVSAGKVAVLAIEGSSGIGKTTVLAEAERRLRARAAGLVVLRGRAAEGEHVPWNLFDGVADGIADVRARTGTLPAVLGVAFPVLREHAAKDGDPNDDVATGLRQALRELGPTALLLDDVQWADADSLRLLSSLLAPPEAPPVLVVLASRSHGARARIAQDVQTISLGPLSPVDVRALLAERHDLEVDAIARESGGHPLFVEELVRAGRETSARSLDGVLAKRLMQLGSRERRILEVLALATEPLSSRAAAEILEEDLDAVTRTLDALRGGRFARIADATDAVRHAPFHDRLAAIVRAELSPGAARAIHAAFVRQLEGAEGAPEAMCHHLEGAGRAEDAGRHALAAAERAERAMAFERQAWFCQKALAWTSSDPSARRALRLRRAEALRRARLSVAAADELVAIAEEDGAGVEGRSLRTAAARLYIGAGELARGQAILASLLQRWGDVLPETYAEAALALARERALLRLDLALPRRLRGAPAPDRLSALRAIAEGLGMIDTLRAAVFHARAVRVALRSPDPAVRAELLAIEAIFVGNASRAGRRTSRRLVARALAPFGEDVPPRVAAFVAAVRAMNERSQRPSHANLGRFKEVEKSFESFGEGDAWVVWSLRLSRSRGARILGDLNEMRSFFYPALAEAERQQDAYARVTLRRSHSLLHLAADEPERARRLLAETHWAGAPGAYHIQDWLHLEARLEADLYEGRAIELAPAQWKRLWRSALHHGDTQRSVHLYMRGRLLLTLPPGRANDARVRVEVARTVRRLVAQREGYALAMARAIRAGLAARRRMWPQAIADLRAVRRLAGRYELLSLGANASLLLGILAGDREAEQEAASFHREHGVRRPAAWARVDFPSFAEVLTPHSASTKFPSSE